MNRSLFFFFFHASAVAAHALAKAPPFLASLPPVLGGEVHANINKSRAGEEAPVAVVAVAVRSTLLGAAEAAEAFFDVEAAVSTGAGAAAATAAVGGDGEPVASVPCSTSSPSVR